MQSFAFIEQDNADFLRIKIECDAKLVARESH